MTSAEESLPNREVQGMAIWLHQASPRLAYGCSSKTNGSREASVFYKSDFT